MFGHWYNSSLKQYIYLLGDLFSKVQVARKTEDGLKYIRVPISNTSKEKFIQSLSKYNNVTSEENVAKVETILPRMNLQMVDMMYNSQFKTAQLNRSRIGENRVSQYSPAPYKMIFELGIYTRYQDDMYQIVEQILPYFQPHFNTTITELYENNQKIDRDIRIAFQSLAIDENSDGDLYNRRHLEWSIMLEVNGWIYPPVSNINGIIKTIYLNFTNDEVQLENNNFAEVESVDHQVVPADVEESEWDGTIKTTYSRNKAIPVDPDEPAPRDI